MSEDVEDHRVTKDICGITHIDNSGREWVCIRPVHAKVYERRNSDRTHKRGDPIFNTNASADQHFMVNRWPYRNKENSVDE